jgi:hypothetical protein
MKCSGLAAGTRQQTPLRPLAPAKNTGELNWGVVDKAGQLYSIPERVGAIAAPGALQKFTRAGKLMRENCVQE